MPDDRGVNKYYYAKVRRQEYKGAKDIKGVKDKGIVCYNGFYRNENGVFESIDEQYYGQENNSGENIYYKDLLAKFEISSRIALEKIEKESQNYER